MDRVSDVLDGDPDVISREMMRPGTNNYLSHQQLIAFGQSKLSRKALALKVPGLPSAYNASEANIWDSKIYIYWYAPMRGFRNYGAYDTQELRQKHLGRGIGKAGWHNESMPYRARRTGKHRRTITIPI